MNVALNSNKNIKVYDPLRDKGGFLAKEDSLFALLPGESYFIYVYDSEINRQSMYYKPILKIQKEWVDPWNASYSLNDKLKQVRLNTLNSWTEWDSSLRYYHGTVSYSSSFYLDTSQVEESICIDFKVIHESAKIWVNGKFVGTLWCFPYRIDIPKVYLSDTNTIKIEVKNLSANKIIEYDRRGIDWKRFYDINMVHIDYKPFNASQWRPRKSGLTEAPVLEW